MNTTTKEVEVPKYGAMEVETLADLMDAITSIVTIGMSGDPGATVRHLSFTRFWADRLAALADREPNGVPFGVLLRIDAGEVARELAPEWSLSSEADFRRGIELLQQHARAFARENLLHHPTIPRPMRAASTRSAPEEDAVDPAGPTVKK
ncbi:MAG: hypothetical protein ABSE96_23840 [Terracidiphilus sp.]